jgi:6-phosphogluconolactonase (cycloisomerase 2 family)
MTKKEITVFPSVFASRRAGRAAARAFSALGLCATFLLAGCNNFFVCEGKASCPSTGGGTGAATTDFAYVSNSSTGSTYVAEYDLTNGSLATISGSPFNLQFQPVALNISPNNLFLYAATLPGAANAGIYLFSIASDGSLSAANNGNVLIGDAVSSMAISPDGGFLFALRSDGTGIDEYQINSSTGALALALTIPVPVSICTLVNSTPVSQTCSVTVAPGGQFVVAALGTAGDAIYPYTSGSGVTTTTPVQISSGSTQSAPTGDYSIVLDDNNFVYIARTAALAVYQITDSAGDAVLKSTASYNSGVTPRSVVLNSSHNYVYTANEGAGTISAYGIGSNGVLTAASGSPFAAPTNVSALGVDNSGKYMVAAGYNSSNGVQLFTIGSTGTLTSVATAATGTSTAYPVVLAMSH